MKFEILLIVISIDSVRTGTRTLPFTTVVTFGDANTDTGNVYNLTNQQWPLVPPYYQGRFSNGPVWIDQLNISNTSNYAYGDATIDNDNLMTGYTGPNQTIVPGIRQQIVIYLTAHNIAMMDLSQTLYVIWAGGTEYLMNSDLSASTVVTSLLAAIDDLLVVGIQEMVVMNLPPLQSYPGMNRDPRLSALITEHNNYLLSNITSIQLANPTVSIQLFDLYSLITKILSNNSIYKLNQIGRCWEMINYTILSQCSNPDQYVFIDNYHFTRVVHQIIASSFYQFILITSSSRISSSSIFCIFMCIILSFVKRS